MMKATCLFLLVALMALFGSDALVSPAFGLKTSSLKSSSALQMTVLSYNGKKKDFKAGSPLSVAAKNLGMKVTYSCKKGDCATCQISVAGRMTKCCVGKVPEEPRLASLKEKGLELKN